MVIKLDVRKMFTRSTSDQFAVANLLVVYVLTVEKGQMKTTSQKP